jgi:hypothetical protein
VERSRTIAAAATFGTTGTRRLRHFIIDIRPQIRYIRHRISLSEGRLRPRVLPNAERVRCPRAERYTPLPGSFGHHAGRHHDRSGRCISLDWDRRARVTPVSEREVFAPRLGRAYRTGRPAASQEAWPEAAPAGLTPRRQEPWWNADRRACPLPPSSEEKRKGARRIARCGG